MSIPNNSGEVSPNYLFATFEFISTSIRKTGRRPLSASEFRRLLFPAPVPGHMLYANYQQQNEETVSQYSYRFNLLLKNKFPAKICSKDSFYPRRFVEFNCGLWYYAGLKASIRATFQPCYHLTLREISVLARNSEFASSEVFSPVPEGGAVLCNEFVVWHIKDKVTCAFGYHCEFCATEEEYQAAVKLRLALLQGSD